MKLYLMQEKEVFWGFESPCLDYIWAIKNKTLITEEEMRKEVSETNKLFLEKFVPYKGLFEKLLEGGEFQLTKEEFNIIDSCQLYYTINWKQLVVSGSNSAINRMLEHLENPMYEYSTRCLYGEKGSRRFVELEYDE